MANFPRSIFPENLFVDRHQPQLPNPVSLIRQASSFLSPITPRATLEQQSQQSLLPSTVRATQQQEALKGGSVLIGEDRSFGLPIGAVNKITKTVAPKVFKGFQDLSTKLLEKLKGRTTVSRQFIDDLTNSPDLKQPERDLIRRVLGEDSLDSTLTAEARKYKNAEEFIGKMKGSSTQYGDYAPQTREYLPDDFKNITELGVNPEETVTIYRGIDRMTRKGVRKINDGDFVTTDFDSAASYAGKENVVSMEVKAKHLYNDNPRDFAEDPFYTGAEYVYSTKKIKPLPGDNELADIWTKSQQGDQISVPDFANKVKSELLPLRRETADPTARPSGGRHESITLPSELRGPVADYNEHIYESPIKTSAGGVHFGGGGGYLDGVHMEASDYPNYFAHTRIEDLPSAKSPGIADFNARLKRGGYMDKSTLDLQKGDTRRVIEIQSDLFQKGRLEVETQGLNADLLSNKKMLEADIKSGVADATDKAKLARVNAKLAENEKQIATRQSELSKLEPYRNTWHERVIREEVKQAAKDGKTKLQFPTGETAMKIEGLGESHNFYTARPPSTNIREVSPGVKLDDSSLKVGQHVFEGNTLESPQWIITKVLPDGKFEAVPKHIHNSTVGTGTSDAGNVYGNEATRRNAIENSTETFDISGKVDTNNPIFKFYEKEVGKYLTNKYGAKRITDPQGVEWYEVIIPKGAARIPVEAFGVGAIPMLNSGEEENRGRIFKTVPQPFFIDNGRRN